MSAFKSTQQHNAGWVPMTQPDCHGTLPTSFLVLVRWLFRCSWCSPNLPKNKHETRILLGCLLETTKDARVHSCNQPLALVFVFSGAKRGEFLSKTWACWGRHCLDPATGQPVTFSLGMWGGGRLANYPPPPTNKKQLPPFVYLLLAQPRWLPGGAPAGWCPLRARVPPWVGYCL